MTKGKKQTNLEFSKLYQAIDDSFDVTDTKIYVMVFGPNLNGDGTGCELRKHIVDKCKYDAYTVVLAEHDEMQQRYTKILGPINDLCKMEYHLASATDINHGQDLIDGIIILPDSAGSLVELGMLVIEDSIHKKILILFNKKYESTISDSFVGKGAKSAFDNGHAMTKIIDYQDLEVAWGEVSKFLELIKSNKLWNSWRKRS